MSKAHKTFYREYNDESQELCMDCDYLRAIPKRLDGSRIEPGRVVSRGVEAAHRNDGTDSGLEVVPVG